VVKRPAQETRRRRIAIALVALAIVLFIAELVALAVGLLEVAALIFVIFIGGWFALRSYQRRTDRA
jgi:Flp pilus assembly protein TadB